MRPRQPTVRPEQITCILRHTYTCGIGPLKVVYQNAQVKICEVLS